MKNITQYVLAAILCISSPLSLAAGQSGANYQIPADVISGGGGDSGSANYSDGHTTGQSSAIGESSSANFRSHAGFWYTLYGVAAPADADNDGIPDDGDGSGVSGDNPCAGGNTESCDDNCSNAANADQADSDGDEAGDACDNCSLTANSGQQDTDNDAYGNACDCDLDNNNFVGPSDFNIFKAAWLSDPSKPNWNANADFDSNNFVGASDFNIFKTRWLKSGPWK